MNPQLSSAQSPSVRYFRSCCCHRQTGTTTRPAAALEQPGRKCLLVGPGLWLEVVVVTDPLSYDDSADSTCYFGEIITQKNAAPPVRISCAVSPQARCRHGKPLLLWNNYTLYVTCNTIERNIVRSWISIWYLIDKSCNLELNWNDLSTDAT